MNTLTIFLAVDNLVWIMALIKCKLVIMQKFEYENTEFFVKNEEFIFIKCAAIM